MFPKNEDTPCERDIHSSSVIPKHCQERNEDIVIFAALTIDKVGKREANEKRPKASLREAQRPLSKWTTDTFLFLYKATTSQRREEWIDGLSQSAPKGRILGRK